MFNYVKISNLLFIKINYYLKNIFFKMNFKKIRKK